MEYLEQCNFDLQYHQGKANVVADALSRKTRCTMACLIYDDWDAVKIFGEFGLELVGGELVDGCERVTLSTVLMQPEMIDRVIQSQQGNARSEKFIGRALSGESVVWSVGDRGELRYRGRLYVPTSMKEEVLKQLHQSRLAVHPGGNKMYHDLNRTYWWPSLKRDIAQFVTRCMTCQLVKGDRKKVGGELQPLEVP